MNYPLNNHKCAMCGHRFTCDRDDEDDDMATCYLEQCQDDLANVDEENGL